MSRCMITITWGSVWAWEMHFDVEETKQTHSVAVSHRGEDTPPYHASPPFPSPPPDPKSTQRSLT